VSAEDQPRALAPRSMLRSQLRTWTETEPTVWDMAGPLFGDARFGTASRAFCAARALAI
jgi:hypothetical protein